MFTKKLQINYYLTLLFFAVFPFGQIFKLISQIYNINLFANPIDYLVLLIAILTILLIPNKKVLFREIKLLLILFLGFLIGTFFLSISNYSGLLYLFRLFSYLIFFINLVHLVKLKYFTKNDLKNILILEIIIIGVIGLLQYLLLPDIRQLFVYGWDDHYYRLVSTFLDPTYTGILIVLGIIATNGFFKERYKFIITLFLLICLSLTFSRASYLSLFVWFAYFVFKKLKRKKNLIFWISLFAALIFLAPKPAGEGVNLLRTKSVILRMENYRESFEIILKNPLTGIGFNNLCEVRDKFAKINSCSGLDSSLFFTFATMGVIGTIALLDYAIYFYKNLNTKDTIFIESALAVFVHSFFSNSFYYSWVIAWLMIVAVISANFKESKLL